MMKPTRRQVLQTSLGAGLIGVDAGVAPPLRRDGRTPPLAPGQLDRILAEPVLRTDLVKTPVKIASLELLRQGPTLLVRARSSDGAESVTVPNISRLVRPRP